MIVKWESVLVMLIAAIPCILVAAAALELVLIKDKDVMKLVKGNSKTLRKRALFMVLFLAVYGAAWMGARYVQYRENPYFVLGFNYSKASQGLNPNGTKFTVAEFTSDKLLGEVISRGGFDELTVEELRDGFVIEPLAAESLHAGETVSLEQPYITTEYQIQYSPKGKKAAVKPRDVLQKFAEVYYNTFVENYSLKTNVLKIDYSELDMADYPDMVGILDSKAESVQRYMEMKNSENATFQSVETGESFNSLAKKVGNFRNVALENLKAYILENGVVKDSVQYTGKLNYDNQLYNVDYLKSQAAYRIYLDVIDRYERDLATIVLVPTRDLNGEFYMSRTKIGVDNFSREADKEVANSKRLSLEIQNGEYAITQFRDGGSAATERNGVEDMVESLKLQLTSLSEAALQTTNEYENKVTNGYMTFTTPLLIDLMISWGVQGGILMIVLLAGLSGCILLKTEKRKKREAQQ